MESEPVNLSPNAPAVNIGSEEDILPSSQQGKLLVSIIVPTRNRPTLLKVALASIAAQEYSRLEVILIDDGSSEDCAAENRRLLSYLQRFQTRYLFLDASNGMGNGPSISRNAGIAAATGELVAFCDDDDEWTSTTHIREAVNLFAADSSLDFAFANQIAVSGGLVVREIWMPDLLLRLSGRVAVQALSLTKDDCLNTPGEMAHLNTSIYRRKFLLAINGFWEGTRYASDYDLFVRAVDGARRIVYRFETVSKHNVPVPKSPTNVSTRLPDTEKQISLLNIASHLVATCQNDVPRKSAMRFAGQVCRSLALDAVRVRHFAVASAWARIGFVWAPTLKWGIYAIYLSARAMIRRRQLKSRIS